MCLERVFQAVSDDTVKLPRIAEIRQENRGGDVSYRDIEWLCDMAALVLRLQVRVVELEAALADSNGCNRP